MRARTGWGSFRVVRAKTGISTLAMVVAASAWSLVACGATHRGTALAVPKIPVATPTATATPMVTATPSTVPTAFPIEPTAPPLPTSAQVAAVGSAVFPYVPIAGGYTECSSSYDVAHCPLSARLRSQIATYAADAAKACPKGCVGGGLISRLHCSSWPHEAVTAEPDLVADVELSGGRCTAITYYIPVIVENNRPVADDVWCGQKAIAFGMYNNGFDAVSGVSCAFP